MISFIYVLIRQTSIMLLDSLGGIAGLGRAKGCSGVLAMLFPELDKTYLNVFSFLIIHQA